MRRARFACVVLAAVAVVAGCGGTGREISNKFGDCTFEPKTVCRNQDLTAVAASNADLAGSDLSGANFTGADLRGADLTNARLVHTNFNGADLTGADVTGADLTDATLVNTSLDQLEGWFDATRTNVLFCNTVMPDGTVTDCKYLQPAPGSVKKKPAPRILRARAHRPVKCIVDGIGDGIEIDFKVKNASSVIFSVDDLRASSTNFAEGIKRIPFTCDSRPHLVSLEAFGTTSPPATTSFLVSVPEGTPQPAPR